MNIFQMNHGRIALLCLAGLLSACAADKPSGYGLAPSGQARAEAVFSAASGDNPRPDNPGMYRSLIERMQSQGLFFASLAHISQFENEYGVTPESTLLRARAQRETGQLELSAAAYRSLLGTQRAAPAWHGLGLIAGAQNDFSAAAQALAQAARLAPTDAMVLNDQGYALLRAGRVVEARLPFAQAAELDAGNGKIVANLAVYLRVTGDVSRADAVMERGALTPATRAAVVSLSDKIRADMELRKSQAPTPSVEQARPATTETAAAGMSDTPSVSRVQTASSSAPLVSRQTPTVDGADASAVSGRPMQSLLERFGAEQN